VTGYASVTEWCALDSCSSHVDHDTAEAFQTYLEEFDPSLSINPTLPSINPSISQAVFSDGPVTVNVRPPRGRLIGPVICTC
jgi:hypothetical protein